MRRVWLIRHSATTAPQGVAIGASDPPLSAAGEERATQIADELASRPLSRVMSSDLRRASAVAGAIAARHRLDVEPAAELRELDFGAWEGRSLADLWVEEREAAQAWEQDICCTPNSFGESLPQLAERVRGFWRSMPGPPEPGEVAIVAHRGPLSVLVSLLTGVSLQEAFATRIELGSVTPVEASWD
jgi:alpha-ribazole phosphatase